MEPWKNKLYFGDNLDILRNSLSEESVDLIYLDPPFNSNATYNVLFDEKTGERSEAQITAFEDTWHWNLESENAFHEIVTTAPKQLADLMQAFRSFLGTNDMMAYLTMMAVRLAELHRVLKPTGSIYLHCDPTASHYLKLLMDAIFDGKNFVNELVWYYPNKIPDRRKKLFTQSSDRLLFYAKQRGEHLFNLQEERREKPITVTKMQKIAGKKVYVRGADGKVIMITRDTRIIDDIWKIPLLMGQAERLGYPTQKPEALLERIIKASSNEGDVILDPFCGCGTTINVAERLHRRWIGIDLTHLAITLIKHRLADTFRTELSPYEVIGDPKDLASAEALAQQDRYQFEWWALGLVDARPGQDKKKGADTGIDGYIYFFDDETGKAKKIVVQVKSGHVTANQIRDLKGVMQRDQAEIGAFITLQEPTGPMLKEAATAGFYEPQHFSNHRCPRLQILTIKELLGGNQLEYPRVAPSPTFKKAERKEKEHKSPQMPLL